MDQYGFKQYMNSFEFPAIKADRQSEGEFIDDEIEVCNYVRGLLILAVKVNPSNNPKYDGKIQPVLTGWLTRIFKLYDTFLLMISDNKIEMAWIFVRLLSEAAIQLKHMLVNDDSENLADKFIKSSLSYDKLLFEHIQNQLESREPTNIESRMMESIKDTIKEEEYEIEDISSGRKERQWCNDTLSLADKLGLGDVMNEFFVHLVKRFMDLGDI